MIFKHQSAVLRYMREDDRRTTGATQIQIKKPLSINQVIPVVRYYACPQCGRPTTWKYECDRCADPRGGDGEDD